MVVVRTVTVATVDVTICVDTVVGTVTCWVVVVVEVSVRVLWTISEV